MVKPFRKQVGWILSAVAAVRMGSAVAEPRPNILMVVIDDTDLSMLSCGGKDPRLMPTLHRLSKEGMLFTNAHTASTVCTPSRFAFQTGLYAGRARSAEFLKENPVSEPYNLHFNVSIDEQTPTLARALVAAGYQTGFSGKWHVGRPLADFGLPLFQPNDDPADPAVDERLRLYQRTMVTELKKTAGYEYAASVFWGNANEGAFPKAVQHHHLEWITKGFLDFMGQRDRSRPFCFSLNPTVMHGPNFEVALKQPINQTQGGRMDGLDRVQASRRSLYERLAAAGQPVNHTTLAFLWLDDMLRAVFDRLEQDGVYQNTMVAFMPDHGNYPHKATCYNQGSLVPLLIRWPGRVPENAGCDALVSSVDLAATFLAAAGVADSAAGRDGVSLLPLFEDPTAEVRDKVFCEFGYGRFVRDRRWSYIALRYPSPLIEAMQSGETDEAYSLMGSWHNLQVIAYLGHPDMLEADQLFDLQNDPTEKENRAHDPEAASELRRMKAALLKYTGSFQHPYPADANVFQGSEKFKELVEAARGHTPPAWYGGGKEVKK